MTFVKSTRIFSSKDINFNYNFKIIKDFKENYKTIHYITIPNYKMENLYQFFKYFLVFYRQISI
ncbi:MAG: hypothetical protein LBQ24_02245 [Candidatus Peribacteria bacterium]|nr:hypothetical protein [Candidatus Peribacteria bacterium]